MPEPGKVAIPLRGLAASDRRVSVVVLGSVALPEEGAIAIPLPAADVPVARMAVALTLPPGNYQLEGPEWNEGVIDGYDPDEWSETGDAPRGHFESRIADALVASTKDQVEHRVVIDVVHDTLLPWCSYLDWEPDPSIIAVANVQHLGTRIEGRLSSPPPNVLELVRALSPTPALGLSQWMGSRAGTQLPFASSAMTPGIGC